MAWAAGAQLGVAGNSSSSTTQTLTTANTVPANSFIIVCATGWINSTTTGLTISLAGGGLTWSQDKLITQADAGGSDVIAIFSAQAPSGLASGTVLTATFGATAFGPSLGGMSFTGGATSSPLDGTGSSVGTAQTVWSANVTTTGSSDLVIACGGLDGTITTNTAAGGFTQGWITTVASANVLAFVYALNQTASTYSPGGTWASATGGTNFNVAAGYLAAAGAVASWVPTFVSPRNSFK